MVTCAWIPFRNGILTSPFLVPANTNLKIWFGISDDKTYPFLLTYNKVRFSTDTFGFANALETTLQTTFVPHFEGLFGAQLPFFHYATIYTGNFKPNDIDYMRIYVQDSDHPAPTEIPDDGSLSHIKLYASFLAQ
ncbi:MAG: hypothetical protein NZL95_06315 [Chitinophagales bacterium]|nr:hypothetical protein [Chitinophagales bacterium]MDW8428151.1 hypothetical protein [Chitinophagales bacterium]